MTDKQINTCEFLNICETNCNGNLEDTEMCHCYELYKQLERKGKEQECEKYKQTLIRIKEIAEPYRMTINKICGNCKKYDSCHACCYKDINHYKYTSSKTNACEEFTYLDKLIPNILSKQILREISECEVEDD